MVACGSLAGCGMAGVPAHTSAAPSPPAQTATVRSPHVDARPSCYGQSRSATCRVLFIGNSYTYVNDLPGMFARLAEASHRTVETDALAEAGETLADHAATSETDATLSGNGWNVVVLQEQSATPLLAADRQLKMYSAARLLVGTIRAVGARPVFFVTPAYRDGLRQYGFSDYAAMQAAIDKAYLSIAQELKVTVAPVGDAWSAASHKSADTTLWQADGSHPTVQGTYLDACVFYATLFHQSPIGLAFRAGLPRGTARRLQIIAADVVAHNHAPA